MFPIRQRLVGCPVRKKNKGKAVQSLLNQFLRSAKIKQPISSVTSAKTVDIELQRKEESKREESDSSATESAKER